MQKRIVASSLVVIATMTSYLAVQKYIDRRHSMHNYEQAFNNKIAELDEKLQLLQAAGQQESLGDFIEDKKVISPVESVVKMNLKEQTLKVLQTLASREEKELRKRFGIGVDSEHTLEEVGQDFDVTRERIRQIESKALRKLRHPSRSKLLKSFIEG